jgi:hypothetical protein
MKLSTPGSLRLAAIFTGFAIALAASASLRAPIEEWEFLALDIRQELATLGFAAPPEDHTQFIMGFRHMQGFEEPDPNCTECHPLYEPENAHSCAWCHERSWGGHVPQDHTIDYEGSLHAPDGEEALKTCSSCHGLDLRGGLAGSCRDCHHLPVWRPAE